MIKALRNFWMLAEEDEKKKEDDYLPDIGDVSRLIFFVLLSCGLIAIFVFKGMNFLNLWPV